GESNLTGHATSYEINQLTGLPSLPYFVVRTEELMHHTKLLQNRPVVVGYVKLLNFREFNEEYSYARGDELLRHIARLLRKALPRRHAAYISGSRFAVLCHLDEIDCAMGRINEGLAQYIPGHPMRMRAGFAEYKDGDAIISLLDKAKAAYESIEDQDGRNYRIYDAQLDRERLAGQVTSLREACLQSAEALHAARAQAAPGLAAVLQEQVRSLEMPRARFVVEVKETAAVGPDGLDEVNFLFDANDRGLRPLSKCASGGELSRIMLCIKSLLAQYKGMPTLIFDEIDAGVSGSVAEKMGQMLSRMGEHMQIFAITHLPQVASKGAAHYLVFKTSAPSGVQTC
ncbi:MAG: diguanylate cyclase domain-containing protein, partial [Bacteroidales bacterium]